MEETKKFSGSSVLSALKQYSMLIALIAVIVTFTITTGGKILLPDNVRNLIFQNAYVVILAVGMLLCILTGGNIDLSVGSVAGFIGAIAGKLIIENKFNVYVSIIICLIFGVLVGMWHGFWIAYVKIPPFIVTLTGMLIFKGLNLIILGAMTLSPYPDSFLVLSTKSFPSIGKFQGLDLTSMLTGIAVVIIFAVATTFSRIRKAKKGYENDSIVSFLLKLILMAAAVIFIAYKLASSNGMPTVLLVLAIITLAYAYLTNKTVAGRYLYAIGGNQKAARLSGINTNKAFFLVYTNMAFLAAVCGLVTAARLNSSTPTAGQGYEMDAIASCFIGGASAYGGIGTVSGALIGAAFMGVLNMGMSIMGVAPEVQSVVKGLVLLLAVAFDVVSKRKTK
jgi:putative multiple sugar transport system permease protein